MRRDEEVGGGVRRVRREEGDDVGSRPGEEGGGSGRRRTKREEEKRSTSIGVRCFLNICMPTPTHTCTIHINTHTGKHANTHIQRAHSLHVLVTGDIEDLKRLAMLLQVMIEPATRSGE